MCRNLNHENCAQHHDDTYALHWSHHFIEGDRGYEYGEYRLKVTSDNGLSRFEVLQASKVQRKWKQQRKHCKYHEEEPSGGGVVSGGNLGGRIHDHPKKRCCHGREEQHNPAIVLRENVMTADVVKRKRKRRNHGSRQT